MPADIAGDAIASAVSESVLRDAAMLRDDLASLCSSPTSLHRDFTRLYAESSREDEAPGVAAAATRRQRRFGYY